MHFHTSYGRIYYYEQLVFITVELQSTHGRFDAIPEDEVWASEPPPGSQQFQSKTPSP